MPIHKKKRKKENKHSEKSIEKKTEAYKTKAEQRHYINQKRDLHRNHLVIYKIEKKRSKWNA